MLKKLLYLVPLLLSNFGFSQTEKLIHGKISYLDLYLKNIDIINFKTKENTTTDEFGQFAIAAKAGEELIFISKEYTYKKIILTQNDIDQNNLIVKLEKEAIELEEVKITKTPIIKVTSSYNDLANIKLEKQQARPTNSAVYTGEITNGMDFIQIGKMVGKLFTKTKTDTLKTKEKIDFKTFVKSNFENDFLMKKLELKDTEIDPFLEFCKIDSKSKDIIQSENLMLIMDYLISKNIEFKKI